MTASLRARDSALIDAIESLAGKPYRGRIWRVVREGKHVLTPSAAGGRWDDGTFDVLYTSEVADGAAAEMYFHLSRGQPVLPSKVAYHLHEIRVRAERTLHLKDLDTIAQLGVDTSRYGALSYNDRHQEYPRTQEVGEAAHFIGFDALVVPNARWQAMNVVVFHDRLSPEAWEVVKDHGPIDWRAWQGKPFGF
jgi:RES domain